MLIITFLGCFFLNCIYLCMVYVCACTHMCKLVITLECPGTYAEVRGQLVELFLSIHTGSQRLDSGRLVWWSAPLLPSFSRTHPFVCVCMYSCMHTFFFVFEFRVFVHVKHMLCLLATPSLLGYVFCFSLTFCSMWGWTQGLMNASQMFYHCAISSALFCFCFFTFYFETGLRLVLNPSCSSGRP